MGNSCYNIKIKLLPISKNADGLLSEVSTWLNNIHPNLRNIPAGALLLAKKQKRGMSSIGFCP